MTAQVPDILICRGERLDLCADPLERYFDPWVVTPVYPRHPRPAFAGSSTACWRGYVASWEIIEEKLYLVGIEGDMWIGEKLDQLVPITIERIFQGRSAPIFANWVRDELRCPEGRLLQYIHAGFASTFERDRLFVVDHGGVSKELLRINPPDHIYYRLNPDGTRTLLRDVYEDEELPDPVPPDIMPQGHHFWGRPPKDDAHEGYLVGAAYTYPPRPPLVQG